MDTGIYKEIELTTISDKVQRFQFYRNRNKKETIELLERYINSDNGEHTTCIDYLLHNGLSRFYRFDLVELRKLAIMKLFIVCSCIEFDEKLMALYKQMKLYQKITNAEVFLAYIKLDTKNKPKKALILNVVSLAEVEKLFSEKPIMKHDVESFSAFYETLKELMQVPFSLGQTIFYRGQSDNNFEPIPSIYRSNNIVAEDHFYHEAIRRKPLDFTESMTAFDNLVKMQHYELPTRLLDTTMNPLVALYFACQEAKNNDGSEADGEVLIYPMWRAQIKYYDSDSVSILANLAKRPIGFSFSQTAGLLVYDIQKDRPKFDGKFLKEDAIHKVFCVLPKLNNDRINNQDGAFFIFGMGEMKNEPASIPQLPYIINVKAKGKRFIMEELKMFGIDEAFLFPETDKVMKQIKQEFTKYIDFQDNNFSPF